jgi:outer membrane receptor for ferrienterochelin and colicins
MKPFALRPGGSPVHRSPLQALALVGIPLLLLGIGASPLAAQDATIRGTVYDAETGQPLSGASVSLSGPATLTRITGGDGVFTFAVEAGSYSLSVTILGYEGHRVEAVRVSEGGTEVVEIGLRSRAFVLNPLVATVGRGVQEKVVEAPGSVSVVTVEDIRARPTPTPLDHLRSVQGVDIATHGVQSGNVVARGFNNIFSGALHMLTDHRLAGVPSLRVNLMHFVPTTDEDIERIEVVLGPGAALYGPNTANGVLHVLTRSPLRDQGTSISVSGGEQSLFQGNFRTAHRFGDALGVKLSGGYLSAREWEYTDPAEVVARDFDVERLSGELRADWRIDDQTTLVFQSGRTTAARGIELTGVGAGQVRDWSYSFYQTRFNRGRLFAQAYLNTSDAGSTFTLRDGDPIVDESKLAVAQVQHSSSLPGLVDLIYGADYFRTMPETGGTIHGRYEDDDQFDEFGAYVQGQRSVTDRTNLVLAGRVDWHSELPDPVFSPRAAVVFTPSEGQSLRATYNRAFSTPTAVNLFLDRNVGPFTDLPVPGFGLWAQGSGGTGFTFRRADGSLTGMRSPFNPAGRDVLIPAEVEVMWPIAVGVLQQTQAIDAETAAFLMQNAPTGAQVGRAYLDVLAGEPVPRPLGSEVSFDTPPIQESTTTTWEVGYKGVLSDRVLLSADLWYSRRDNFVSALRPTTPLLFLEGSSVGAHIVPGLTQHFMERGLGQEQAQGAAVAIVEGLAGIPVGVLSSDQVGSAAGRSDFLVTYRNFGRVNLWGSDIAGRVLLNDEWSVDLGVSWVNRDHFETEGEVIALNAPQTKLRAGVQYRDPVRGISGELRTRYNAEFPVLSAPYIATQCLGDTGPLVEPCVESFFLVDIAAGYRLAQLPGTSVHLSIQNVLDAGYRSFAGVPDVGRMALIRLRYEF